MSASAYYNAAQGYNKLPPQGPHAYHPDPAHEIIDPTQGSSKGFNNYNRGNLGKWTRHIRIIIILSSAATGLFTLFMEGIMAFMFYKFYSTHNKQANGRGPWAKETKLWPTWLLFVASGVTLVITMFSLCILCCSKKAQKSKRVWLTVAKYSVHVFSWLAVSIFYRVGKTGDDLWGWSCSEKAAAVQSEFPELNFQSLCNLQSGSWYVTIVEVSVKVIFAFGHYLFYRRSQEHAVLKLGSGLGGIALDQIT